MKICGQNKKPVFKPIKRSIQEPIILALVGVIRERREARGWSREDLVEKADLTYEALRLIEKHQREPSAHLVVRLGRALGVMPDVLYRQAQRRAARWPDGCEKCNYCCVENGRLVSLNSHGVCTRPKR